MLEGVPLIASQSIGVWWRGKRSTERDMEKNTEIHRRLLDFLRSKEKKIDTQTDAEQLLPFSNIIHSGITLVLLVGIPQNFFSSQNLRLLEHFICVGVLPLN